MVSMSSSSSPPPLQAAAVAASSTTPNNDVTPQQIGKAFVVQYYRLLHENPDILHRFYSSSSTFMHDDPTKTVIGSEAIAERIKDLSFKQRHVKIRQVDCHSTVGSSVVVQVCGEMSSISDDNKQQQQQPPVSPPTMRRFVQTFVLAPTTNAKQKYYVHNDIFRYQDGTVPTSISTTETKTNSAETNEVASFGYPSGKTPMAPTPTTPSSSTNFVFLDNAPVPTTKKDETSSSSAHYTPPATPVDEQHKSQEKEQPSQPKSYRDAIGKKEKAASAATATESQPTAAAATAPAKAAKSGKQQNKASKSGGGRGGRTRGHPQDVNDYYDDSWYYGGGEEGYLHTGYTDDQEIFVGNLSAQVTEEEIRELFRPYGHLLLVRIGNTGSQTGAANFAFVVCQSVEMAATIVADHDNLLATQKVNVEAKKRRPFPHTFRPSYPTAAAPSNYQSTGYSSCAIDPASSSYYYDQSSSAYYGGGARGLRRGGRGRGGGR